MSRTYPERPIVGIGVVVVRGDEVLMIQRGKPPRQGQWSLPGGAQKLGETVFEAGRREVLEETGLTLDWVDHLAVVDLIDRDEADAVRYHYTLVDLVATSAPGEPVAGSDAMGVCWAGPAEIEAMGLWTETRRIIAMALEKTARRAS
ncbi:MAG: NUDIX hydrolase [Geminicoccaceae bacterium]